jgi:hypothetical protein
MSTDFRNRVERVEELLGVLDGCADPAVREAARELARALLDLHSAGLARALELAGPDVTDRLADDELVSSLLLIHGLHPLPADARVRRSVGRLRPLFRSLGGDVELLSATDTAARLRLRGDPAAGPALRAAATEAVIGAAPDVTAVEFEEAWDGPLPGRVPLPLVAVRRDG